MSVHIKRFRKGFPLDKQTTVARFYDKQHNESMQFGILSLKKGGIDLLVDNNVEICYVLLQGKVEFIPLTKQAKSNLTSYVAERNSLIDECPSTFVISPHTDIALKTLSKTAEIAYIATDNKLSFKPRYFPPSQIKTEHRGKGKLNNTAYRYVRTVFDKRNMPQSNLVVGEVITLPGRWSSYPPHHHPQPEIYFYRFFPEEGYGFAQVGDDVYKVENNDLIKIPAGKDHPQVAAPGYTMWYLWVIRHLPRKPYIEPEFTKKHKWVFENEKRVWKG